ncbi:MAG TPA: ribosome recycling factor [Candidatus Doudnabacteria bacterium]|nr:ribosome recycling factor [Candidatus Doudnabacteria bacterium]
MINDIIKQHKEQFEKVMEHFHHELSSVRTGRANPALLSTVMVESYGTKMPLAQVANITVSDAKTLTISPWDKGQLGEIEKGIQAANLGFNPSNDGNVVRITLPPMTEERRKEMVKLVGQVEEQARIGVRQVREEIIKAVKKQESDGQATKDDVASAQKKVQEVVDKYNEEIKQVAKDKEQELLTV